MRDDPAFPSRTQLSRGTRLNGIYEIDEVIAQGGMGEIYKGHTIQTGDTVAIKVLLPEFAANEAALGLFRREASALHNLHHEAIVRYYVFTIEPVLKRPYLAMEFVEGKSLKDIVQHEPLTYEAARSLLVRVASGLHAAHERGIIHRDVSSDNIMIPGGDVARAKIIDFGIARSTQRTDGTIIGSGFAGKYNYVSPEQLGLFGGEVGAKSDIYSLALVLIEALTGQPIDMGGSQLQVIDKRRKIPDLGAIDLRIRPLLERMLQPDPEARPDSMAQVATWPLPTSHPRDSRYIGADGRQPKQSRAARSPGRGRWIAAAAIAVALIAGGGGATYYLMRPDMPGFKEPPAPPPLGTGKSAPTPGDSAKLAPPPGPSLTPGNAPALPTSPQTSPTTSTTPQPPPPAETKKGPDVAVLTPSAPVGRADAITRYINQYDGGDCFFIVPTAVTSNTAKIDGYGATGQPFDALDTSFKSANGFEAAIDVRQVTAAQCPALTFLGRLRANRAQAPQLQVSQASLRSGEALTGRIEGPGEGSIQLLLVSDEGQVQDVSVLLKPSGDARVFNMKMQRSGAPGAQPQLLIALRSARPLETLRGAQSTPADQLFPLALAEITRSGQTVGASIRYFKLDL
jgi:serine/threonine-protein kinase